MTTGRKKRRRRRRGRTSRKARIVRYIRRNSRILILILVCAVLLITGIFVCLRNYVKNHDDGTILSGVSIGGIDVSGMTKEEAADAVNSALSDYQKEGFRFVLEDGDQVEASLEELGMSAPKLEDTIEKAVSYGKSGNVIASYKIMKKAEKNKLEHDFPLQLEVEEETASRVLAERAEGFLDQPVNASVTQNENGVVLVEEKEGEVLDAAKTVEVLNEYLNNGWDGKGGTVEIAVTKEKPEITAEDLKEVTDLLGTYTTFYGSDGSGRSQNVESGAMHINGALLQPGEEMSANEAMEPYTYENGYAEAASYESNTVVQTMGGGICQVSTTLYNAILFAELEIVERYPHSMLVSYVEPSMDAAIADDLLDLVFKNNQKTPVYIEAVLSEGCLTFNIYGKETRDPGRSLQFISEMTESKETEGKRFVATEDYIGYIGLQSASHPEISARLWKVVYQDGEEVSRDIINYSQYVAAPETYGVGTYSDDPADTEKINNALLTQDEAAIQAAIQEVLTGEASADAETEVEAEAEQDNSGQGLETQR